jgi:hypothetical protein
MAAGGIAFTGSTGEDYAIPFTIPLFWKLQTQKK